MKKTAVTALTAALVVGAVSTTFAAANPFSDVPANHWAYKSVTDLAAKGVIEGMGDGTYQGTRSITRYEMAQMVAKALAKNPTGADKAELEKLKAYFQDELNSLGVRVDELEKHSDMVKWTGEVRYRYWHDKEDLKGGGDTKRTRSQLQLRLFPTAEINENWTAKARFTATEDAKIDQTGDVELTYIYAEGKYDKFGVKIGRMPLWNNVDSGMTVDDFFSGLQLIYGDKVKVQVEGGRWKGNWTNPSDYAGIELRYDDKSRFDAGLSYRHFKTKDLKTRGGYGNEEKANVWSVGAGYKFNDDFKLSGAFAKNNKANDYSKAFNVGLNYKGANRKAGSWGAFAFYRYVGQNASFAPTYDSFNRRANKKGVDIGLNWSPFKNTLTQVSYFWGKTLDTKENDRTFFGRVSFFF